QNVGRQWTVPEVQVLLETDGADPEEVQVTIDSVLASQHTDLAVTVPGAESLPRWLRDYVGSDARVRLVEELPASGFPSPVTVRLSAGVVLERATLGRVLTHLREGGGVRTDVAPGRSLVGQTTRALLRRRHATDRGALPAPTPVPAGARGVAPAPPRRHRARRAARGCPVPLGGAQRPPAGLPRRPAGHDRARRGLAPAREAAPGPHAGAVARAGAPAARAREASRAPAQRSV